MRNNIGKMTVLLLVMVLLLSGCAGKQNSMNPETVNGGDSKPSESTEYTEPASPVKVFQEELDTVMEEPGPENESDGAQLDEAILKLVRYSTKVIDNHTAEIMVKAPDMRAIILQDGDNLLEYEDGIQRIITALKEEKVPMVTTIVSVELDENGTPQESYELQDAMYGGLLTVIDEMLSYREDAE